MNSFFVDTDRLSERYKKGLMLEGPVREDIKDLQDSISVICEELKDRGRSEQSNALQKLMDEISGTAGSIMEVCSFDSFAVHKYRELFMKIDDIVSAIEI